MPFQIRPAHIFALLILALPVPARADAQKLLGTYGHWRAYSFNENDQPVCYMALTTQFPANKKFKRGTADLTITHRPGENTKDVVSYTAGYIFKPASSVTIRIGKTAFSLFTSKDTAWAREAHDDHLMTAAIRTSKSMTVTGVPAAKIKGWSSIIDTLDPTGAARAYQAIGKACGYMEDGEQKPPAGKLKKH